MRVWFPADSAVPYGRVSMVGDTASFGTIARRRQIKLHASPPSRVYLSCQPGKRFGHFLRDNSSAEQTIRLFTRCKLFLNLQTTILTILTNKKPLAN